MPSDSRVPQQDNLIEQLNGPRGKPPEFDLRITFGDVTVAADWEAELNASSAATTSPASSEAISSPDLSVAPVLFHDWIPEVFPAPASTRMPQELFDEILYHVVNEYQRNRPPCLYLKDSECEHIATCSLITSFDEVERFIKYAYQGCASLIPVYRLIQNLEIKQRFTAPFSSSFYFNISPCFWLMGRPPYLRMIGPIPSDFPLFYLLANQPQWGTPSHDAAISPMIALYERVNVENVYLPSFEHVRAYVKHLGIAGQNIFERFTWYEEDPDGQGIYLREHDAHYYAMDRNLFVRGTECTKNLALCIQVLLLHPRSVLRVISDDETQRIINLLWWASDTYVTKDEDIHNPDCDIWTTPQMLVNGELEGLLELGIAIDPKDCCSGCGIWFGSSCRYEKEGTEGGVVWNAIKDLLQHLPSFRGDLLVAATQLSNTNCKLAIGYDRRSGNWDENDASTIVGVDPTTLIPNGQTWDHHKDIVPSLLGYI